MMIAQDWGILDSLWLRDRSVFKIGLDTDTRSTIYLFSFLLLWLLRYFIRYSYYYFYYYYANLLYYNLRSTWNECPIYFDD